MRCEEVQDGAGRCGEVWRSETCQEWRSSVGGYTLVTMDVVLVVKRTHIEEHAVHGDHTCYVPL